MGKYNVPISKKDITFEKVDGEKVFDLCMEIDKLQQENKQLKESRDNWKEYSKNLEIGKEKQKELLDKIYQLLIETLQKSEIEIRRINNGGFNPNVTIEQLAKGCEYDIQRLINKIINLYPKKEKPIFNQDLLNEAIATVIGDEED